MSYDKDSCENSNGDLCMVDCDDKGSLITLHYTTLHESCAPLQRILSPHSGFLKSVGRSGGAMMLGNLPVPGCPTNLVDGRASAVGAGGHFFSLLPPSVWETV